MNLYEFRSWLLGQWFRESKIEEDSLSEVYRYVITMLDKTEPFQSEISKTADEWFEDVQNLISLTAESYTGGIRTSFFTMHKGRIHPPTQVQLGDRIFEAFFITENGSSGVFIPRNSRVGYDPKDCMFIYRLYSEEEV